MNLQAVPGDTVVDLTWDAVDEATGYNAYVDGVFFDDTATNSIQVTGLTNGVEYDFTVSSLGAWGESAECAPVSATPVFVRSAFVETAAPGGTLNDPNDPYGMPSTALAALEVAYPAQSVTVYMKDESQTEDLTSANVSAFSAVKIKGYQEVRTYNFATVNLNGSDGGAGVAGGNGGSITFDSIESTGTVSANGGNGGNGDAASGGSPATNGGNAGTGGTITLLNNTVIANVTVDGGTGGTGGDGDGSFPGGDGGNGGSGGIINHDATSSATTHSESSNAPGGGGADGGAGAGNSGSPGESGSYNLI